MSKRKEKIIIISILLTILILIILNITVFFNNINIEKEILVEDNENKELKEVAYWLEGNKYSLHNPLSEEVINFYENINTSSINETINLAKKNGLNCSFVYVQVLINNEPYVFELMGFNTIDKGMIYFQQKDFEEVKPKIGEYYIEENYIVNDILHIW